MSMRVREAGPLFWPEEKAAKQKQKSRKQKQRQRVASPKSRAW